MWEEEDLRVEPRMDLNMDEERRRRKWRRGFRVGWLALGAWWIGLGWLAGSGGVL